MKMKKTEKIGDVRVRGIHFVIIRRWNEEMTVTDYVLSMKWCEPGKDGRMVNKQHIIGKYNYLKEALNKLYYMVEIAS